MRAADEEPVKARCREAVPRVLHVAGLPTEGGVRRDDEGWVNPCFFVGDDVVVRFNARDVGVPKFRREAAAYDLLLGSGLPVPRVVHLEPAGDVTPYEALVTTRLPGVSLERSWPSLTESYRRQLPQEAGRLLARLHDVGLQGFGEPWVEAEARAATWREHVERVLAEHVEAGVACGSLSAREAERVERVLAERGHVLDAVLRPALVHRDFHFGNLLVDGGAITGIIDFEWCVAGDPELDLMVASAIEEVSRAAARRFVSAYREVRPESAEWTDKRDLYACWHDVELGRVARLYLSEAEAAAFRRATTALLDRLAPEG